MVANPIETPLRCEAEARRRRKRAVRRFAAALANGYFFTGFSGSLRTRSRRCPSMVV